MSDAKLTQTEILARKENARVVYENSASDVERGDAFFDMILCDMALESLRAQEGMLNRKPTAWLWRHVKSEAWHLDFEQPDEKEFIISEPLYDLPWAKAAQAYLERAQEGCVPVPVSAIERAGPALHESHCASYWTSDDDTVEHFDASRCDCEIAAVQSTEQNAGGAVEQNAGELVSTAGRNTDGAGGGTPSSLPTPAPAPDELAHDDHPLRVFDRTCAACLVEEYRNHAVEIRQDRYGDTFAADALDVAASRFASDAAEKEELKRRIAELQTEVETHKAASDYWRAGRQTGTEAK